MLSLRGMNSLRCLLQTGGISALKAVPETMNDSER
jgi:hypothetical protein